MVPVACSCGRTDYPTSRNTSPKTGVAIPLRVAQAHLPSATSARSPPPSASMPNDCCRHLHHDAEVLPLSRLLDRRPSLLLRRGHLPPDGGAPLLSRLAGVGRSGWLGAVAA